MCAVSMILDYARVRVNPASWTPEVLTSLKDLLKPLEALDTALGEPACEHAWEQRFISEVETLIKQRRP